MGELMIPSGDHSNGTIQGQHELRIFRSFAAAAGLDVAVQSIRKRSPPFPDVYCLDKDGSPMAFELVQIFDNGLARSISDQITVQSLFYEEYYNLPRALRTRLKPFVENALIGVWFKPSASLRARKHAIPSVLSRLQKLTTATETELSIPPDLRPTVRRLRISRGEFVGPSFYVDGVTSFGDPIIESVNQKFKKSYPGADPIDLLAFYELQRPSPQDLWLPRLHELVVENLHLSPFTRVWVYDVVRQNVQFVYPAIKNRDTLIVTLSANSVGSSH